MACTYRYIQIVIIPTVSNCEHSVSKLIIIYYILRVYQDAVFIEDVVVASSKLNVLDCDSKFYNHTLILIFYYYQ